MKSIAVKKHGDMECVCYSTINPLDTNISIYFLHTVLYVSYGTDKENLFNNQQLLLLVIISLILVTSMFVFGVILMGENGY